MLPKHAATALASIAIAGLIAGCNTTDQAGAQKQAVDIAEIRATLNKQQEDIAALRKELESKNAGGQDQLFNAAALLARNCPENQLSMAISMLGAVGGSKAEPILLEMLEKSSPNQYSAILNALSNMRSQKFHDIVMKFLTSGNNRQLEAAVNVLQNNNSSMVQKSDLPVIEKALENVPDNNNGNNRYLRNMLIGIVLRLDQDKGVQYICDDLQAAPVHRKREIIYLINNNNLYLRPGAWERIMKNIGDPDESSIDAYYTIMQSLAQSGDWRATDLIMSLADFAETNDNFRRQFFETLIRLKDPKAAKTVLDLYHQLYQQKKSEIASARATGRGNMDNYPGIKKENDNYVLVDDAAMQKLLELRAKKIERLNEQDKKRTVKKEKI